MNWHWPHRIVPEDTGGVGNIFSMDVPETDGDWVGELDVSSFAQTRWDHFTVDQSGSIGCLHLQDVLQSIERHEHHPHQPRLAVLYQRLLLQPDPVARRRHSPGWAPLVHSSWWREHFCSHISYLQYPHTQHCRNKTQYCNFGTFSTTSVFADFDVNKPFHSVEKCDEKRMNMVKTCTNKP